MSPAPNSLLRDGWLVQLCVARALMQFIAMTYAGALPLLRTEWAMSATAAGSISTSAQLGYAVSLMACSWMADRIGARRVFMASCVASALTSVAFALFARSYLSALLLYTLVSSGQGGTYTTMIMLFADRYSPARRGAAVGWLIAALSLGYALSLALTGLALSFGGYPVAFVVTAAGSVAGTALAAVALRGTPNVVHPRPEGRAFAREVLKSRTAMLLMAGYTAHSWELLGAWAWPSAPCWASAPAPSPRSRSARSSTPRIPRARPRPSGAGRSSRSAPAVSSRPSARGAFHGIARDERSLRGLRPRRPPRGSPTRSSRLTMARHPRIRRSRRSAMAEMVHVGSGKVRELYALDAERMLLVASDRISVFDVVLPTAIPDKGRVLTGLSAFWFSGTTHIGPNHLLAVRPDARSTECRRLEMLPIECVVRGYLAGSGWKDYQASGEVCGHRLPVGLRESDRLPQPIFTPATKATSGHDENIATAQAAALVGDETFAEAQRLAIALYRFAADYARGRGIIIADTKFEFGRDREGRLVLGDEALTPDSSRFWPADEYAPGRPQPSYDKQFVRDFTEKTGWGKTYPGPELPDDVVAGTRARYVEAFEKLTGIAFDRYVADPSVVLATAS